MNGRLELLKEIHFIPLPLPASLRILFPPEILTDTEEKVMWSMKDKDLRGHQIPGSRITP